MAFTQGTLDEIRERVDIVELIGSYVQLKKSGKNFMGLCPFHKEKGASFSVEPGKQFFFCFACQKGGNIFTFVQEFDGVSFPEAVQRLARRAGVEVKEEDSTFQRSAPQKNASHERLYEALELATKFYQYLLFEKKEYKPALDYILSRGISKKTMETFRIGVSPTGWNTFMDLAIKRGFKFEELVASGLVIEKENSPKQGYDRFRHRLMFPITNKDGRIIGFGARILDKEQEGQPKYLNSSDSPVFSKRRNLYGLYENQRGIRLRGDVVVVEGYMDVVGLYESGVTNAVATMGTALTEEHLRELRSLTKNIITVFDPDNAGEQAFQRSIPLCMQEGFFAKNLALPNGLDPDEFVQKEGAETFYQLCDKAPTQITQYLKDISKKGSLAASETSKVLEALTPILVASRRLPDRALLWDDISLVLKVSIESLRQLAEQAAQRMGKPAPAPQQSRPVTHTTKAKAPASSVVDQEFLYACIRWPEEFLKLPKEEWLGSFKNSDLEIWLQELSETTTKEAFEKKIEALVHRSPSSLLASTAMSAMFDEQNAATKTGPSFGEVLERVRKRKRDLEVKALTTQVKLTQRAGDESEQLRLLEKMKELKKNVTS